MELFSSAGRVIHISAKVIDDSGGVCLPRLRIGAIKGGILDIVGIVGAILILNAVAAVGCVGSIVGVQYAIGDVDGAVCAKALDAVCAGQGASGNVDGRIFACAADLNGITIVVGLHFDLAVHEIDSRIINAENLYAAVLVAGNRTFGNNLPERKGSLVWEPFLSGVSDFAICRTRAPATAFLTV